MNRVLSRSLAIAGVVSLAGLALAFGPEAGKAAAGSEASCCSPCTPGTMMDAVKLMAGEWEMTDETGTQQLALSSRLIAAGNVLCETMFPGSDHEMVNMYHLDNGSLVVTHYCAIGNQPRMVYTPAAAGSSGTGAAAGGHDAHGGHDANATHATGASGGSAGHAAHAEGGSEAPALTYPIQIEFKFKDCTNLKDANAMYMGGLKVTLTDENHLVQEWTHYANGKANTEESPRFELVRKAGTKAATLHAGEHEKHDTHADKHESHATDAKTPK